MPELVQEAATLWWDAYTSYICERVDGAEVVSQGENLVLVFQEPEVEPDILNDAEQYAWNTVRSQFSWRGWSEREEDELAGQVQRMKEERIQISPEKFANEMGVTLHQARYLLEMREPLRDVALDLLNWMYSEPPEFNLLVWKILAALPGGESLADYLEGMGEDPAPVGWNEVDMLGKLLTELRYPGDVYRVSQLFMNDLAEEEMEDSTDE